VSFKWGFIKQFQEKREDLLLILFYQVFDMQQKQKQSQI